MARAWRRGVAVSHVAPLSSPPSRTIRMRLPGRQVGPWRGGSTTRGGPSEGPPGPGGHRTHSRPWRSPYAETIPSPAAERARQRERLAEFGIERVPIAKRQESGWPARDTRGQIQRGRPQGAEHHEAEAARCSLPESVMQRLQILDACSVWRSMHSSKQAMGVEHCDVDVDSENDESIGCAWSRRQRSS